MLTVFEALTYGNEKLKSAQKEKRHALQNPKLDAQVLLSHCLKKPTSYLFAHGDELLSPEANEQYLALIERRAKHEPISYILGEKEFYKRPFFVTPATLIPRPETELLVELALKDATPGTVFADIGTGSGAIAITLAAESASFVFATDISSAALQVAKKNAERHGVQERIFFLEGDLLLPFVNNLKEWLARAELKRMTIVANLPYVPQRQFEGLDPDILLYEPHQAIVGGIGGLEIYERLMKQLVFYRDAFPPQLRLIFEMDPSHELTAGLLVRRHFPNAKVNVVYDQANRARFIDAML